MKTHLAVEDFAAEIELEKADAAFIAALSPATVSRIARVVTAARALTTYPGAKGYWEVVRSIEERTAEVRDAIAALDADAPEGGAGK